MIDLKKWIDRTSHGVIVESGTNSDGNFVRWSDGTQICYKTIKIRTAITEAWGSIFCSPLIELGQWAKSFIKAPSVSATSGLSNYYTWLSNVAGTKAVDVGHLYLLRPDKASQENDYSISVVGFGKWK